PRDVKSPEKLTISGKLNGKAFVREAPVKDVADKAGYLPRVWAKLEIDRLLAEDAETNKQQIIDLSMAGYVMSPYTSLLVLETEADCEGLKGGRGRKDQWAMYEVPERIKSKGYEAEGGIVRSPKAEEAKKDSARVVRDTIVTSTPPRVLGYADPLIIEDIDP